MSALTRFAASMFTRARSVIGGETVAINDGAAISAVVAETDESRDLDSSGFDRDQSLTVTVSIADWSANYPCGAKAYFGKTAVCRERTWRVGDIKAGQSFVTIRFTNPRKGA
jgi:hypothetical protein